MSKSKQKAPLLFIDSVPKGCFVNEQQIYKTPNSIPKDVVETDYVHHYDRSKKAKNFDWPEENEEN